MDIRDALKHELISRGHTVASDTLGSRGELYVMGDRDLARALFEFAPNAEEAFERLYAGSWTAGLPPRFAVLPASAANEPDYELLAQAHIVPLLYEIDGETVRFCNIAAVEEALAL